MGAMTRRLGILGALWLGTAAAQAPVGVGAPEIRAEAAPSSVGARAPASAGAAAPSGAAPPTAGGSTAFTLAGAGAGQVLLVLTDGWDAKTGTLWRFERGEAGFTRVGDGVPVVVGRSGLAWGRGLHPAPGDGPVKREGDGRAPAGVFRLGPAAGYAEAPPAGVTLPYRASASTARCVDDPASAHYNRLVDESAVTVDWKSSEVMRRRDGLYEWLLVVEHNTSPAPVPGGGSCIFLHVWRAADKGTAGCTALAKDALVDVLRWLRADRGPVLVQLPRTVHAGMRETWGLPSP